MKTENDGYENDGTGPEKDCLGASRAKRRYWLTVGALFVAMVAIVRLLTWLTDLLVGGVGA